MTSTHEAFSLPTTSPALPTHPDTFNIDTLQPAEPPSPSYTYPPQSPMSAFSGYVTTPSRSRPTSLLPLHNIPYTDAMTPPPPPYPPLATTWNRVKVWLAREYPELGDTLNYGILPQDLAQIEMQFGFALPQAVRESYLVLDGQEAESSAGCSEGLFFGLSLLPLEDVLEEWRFWREVDDDPMTGANPRLRDLMRSIPDGWIRKEYSQRGWIPLVVDKVGNYIGVDLNPGESGSVGQVIVFGRDFDTKVVLWHGDSPGGWARWLSNFADELESGEGFELGQGNNDGEGSEDELGYEAYFYDGNGRGQGDGGGEGGLGGLRMSGAYKGWNPMEAWADKSVKKWYEAGLFDISPSTEKGKVPDNHGLGVLNLDESATVVPIPVFGKQSCEEPSALADVTNVGTRVVPAISVTKPPAPQPVNLPSVSDVVPLPSPPDSNRSSVDVDLEAGRGVRRLVDDNVITSKSSLRKVTPPDAAPNDDPLEPSPTGEDADLLTHSAPLEGALGPSSPVEPERTTAIGVADSSTALPLAENDVHADSTIRLVGGGSLSGDTLLDNAEEAVVCDVPVAVVAESSGSPLRKETTSDKVKSSSLSSFKRLSAHLVSGKRKKDSVSSNSVKETL
ncbi:hypothetical protein L210DRAFT_3558415 [Boletus edulis BED1]|uniref:Knr4/Smi1-like domain-containing protein n=1 Tax=Boletus edulis BED1 TaxID=1328754 RepID=A0AAD4BJ36_BOLED|nr:hypothetical protein L210DRAFT_3558415 [Boletus edulis BED1]